MCRVSSSTARRWSPALSSSCCSLRARHGATVAGWLCLALCLWRPLSSGVACHPLEAVSSSSAAPPSPVAPLAATVAASPPPPKTPSLASSLIGEDVGLDFVHQVAQSLRTCGLHGAAPLRRKFLTNQTVTCNDGSAAGYYIRKSHGSKRWVVFLEGGWYCYDRRSCFTRWHRLRNLMSSKSWTETRIAGGIMSNDPQENRHWWNANHVYVPYCSSDSWSGSAFAENTGNFAFHGSLIVEEVIKDLLTQGLLASRRLLLAGSSAGGLGVLLNVDRVGEQLRAAGSRTHLRGVSDSGWFLDNRPYAPAACSGEAGTDCLPPVDETVRRAVRLWAGRLPEACARQQAAADLWKCYFGYRIYPTLRTPVFVFQWLFDEAQLTVNNVGAPFTKEQWDYIHQVGDHFRQTLQNLTAVFAPSCISHVVLTKRDWRSVKVNSTSLPDALNCWEQQYGRGVHQHLPRHRNHHPQKQRPLISTDKLMLSDAPGKHQKRKPNAPPAHQQHPVVATSNNVSTDVTTTNVTSVSGVPFPLVGDSGATNTTTTTTTVGTHKSKKGRSRNKGKKKRNRLRHSKGHKNRTQRNAFGSSDDVTATTTAPVVVTSPQPHQGCRKFQYLDECTWPQCNGGCPKLLNPFTGEEMDFIELLKSFGLDMSSVAMALGMELDALNAMGNDKLLQILTQHSRK